MVWFLLFILLFFIRYCHRQHMKFKIFLFINLIVYSGMIYILRLYPTCLKKIIILFHTIQPARAKRLVLHSQFTIHNSQCTRIISHYGMTGFLHSQLLHRQSHKLLFAKLLSKFTHSAYLCSTIFLNNFSSPPAQRK